uniref:Urocanate hydratase n=1 Tax=Phallusia mammillata TaxID=59560 RepID=A0A6F9DWY2_9ASCI|nr:urocanate hydratase-like [Phallusia mammillata]
MSRQISLQELCSGIPDPLPDLKTRDEMVPHAPYRNHDLTTHQTEVAIRNALRYFPPKYHQTLSKEFRDELEKYGHIYMYRLIPDIEMKAYPIDEYPCKSKHAAAIMHMIMNNLDHRVAQFPHELVTYGGNGQVFSNWAQFRLTMKYLSVMTDEQTLVMCSGHPQGLYPSTKNSPRAVISNGMVIPNYSSTNDYNRMFAMGVSMYGQMTAGSFCYIGPQGIVHGTTITVLNAGRKYLGVDDMRGKIFVTSGLGGMSGAQAKAAVIAGCVGVIAEVDETALNKRHKQGWLMEKTSDLDELLDMIKKARNLKQAISIGYHGNVVDLWEKLVKEYKNTGELHADLGSDQTSLHNPFNGGYYPVGLSFSEANKLMQDDPQKFKTLVQESLVRHVAAINVLSDGGMYFWDYGNAFLLEAKMAGADILKKGATVDASSTTDFRYPSYVQHIMGDIFSLGFGPFRWVCTSAMATDLAETDCLAAEVISNLMKTETVTEAAKQQYADNIKWIKEAGDHKLVVGSQARILYSDQQGRVAIARAFNQAVKNGRISAPVVISRDHHDVSGTDSPFRETSNIYDGSAFCADMAVQNCIGDSFRGATWVALHNGGGVGWGEVINGGFGMVLDGSDEAEERAKMMLNWDVNNGVTRRAWSGNQHAKETIEKAMRDDPRLKVTVPYDVDL